MQEEKMFNLLVYHILDQQGCGRSKIHPGARPMVTIITAVWGIGLLLECGVQVMLALTLSIEQVLLLSPIVRYGMWAILLLWAIFFSWICRRDQSRMPEDFSREPIQEPTRPRSFHE